MRTQDVCVYVRMPTLYAYIRMTYVLEVHVYVYLHIFLGCMHGTASGVYMERAHASAHRLHTRHAGVARRWLLTGVPTPDIRV